MSCVTQTKPAELVFAYDAGHVVASFVLFNLCPTDRTETDASVLVDPALKFLVHVFLAGSPAMPFVSTLEAYIGLTHWAPQFFSFEIFTSHRARTARLGTPAHQRVTLLRLLVD